MELARSLIENEVLRIVDLVVHHLELIEDMVYKGWLKISYLGACL